MNLIQCECLRMKLRMESSRVLRASLRQLRAKPKDLYLVLFPNGTYISMKVWIDSPFFSESSKKANLIHSLHFPTQKAAFTWSVFSFACCTLLLPNLSWGFFIAFLENPAQNRHSTLRIHTSKKSQNRSSVSGQPAMITTGLPHYAETLTLPHKHFPQPSSSLDGWNNSEMASFPQSLRSDTAGIRRKLNMVHSPTGDLDLKY